MIRVLFVCTGNICRSPLAEAVFNQQAKERGLSAYFETESGGTHAYHLGENADPRTRRNAEGHGLGFSHFARKVSVHDLDEFDCILAMGSDHLVQLQLMARTDEIRDKIVLYRSFDPRCQNLARIPDVPDPYYGGPQAFEEVFQIVQETTKELLVALAELVVKGS